MKIATSILSANFANLGIEVASIENAGADYIHIDVMDGSFVPNITIGSPVVHALRKCTTLPLDVHLMVNNPEKQLENFVDSGSDMITIHIESAIHVERIISNIKAYGKKAGIALVPHTHHSSIEYLINSLDLILVMSVNPGFGGQKFLHSQLKKIEAIKEMCIRHRSNALISVDGGVNSENICSIKNSGADIAVIGSAIFSSADYKSNIDNLKKLVS